MLGTLLPLQTNVAVNMKNEKLLFFFIYFCKSKNPFPPRQNKKKNKKMRKNRTKHVMYLKDWKDLAKRYKLRGYSTQRKSVITQRVMDYSQQTPQPRTVRLTKLLLSKTKMQLAVAPPKKSHSKCPTQTPNTAASIIQSNWKKHIEMLNSTCCLTYFTIRELKELGMSVYMICETPNVVNVFSALHFAKYMCESLDFSNPHTRRELNEIEVLRLINLLARCDSDAEKQMNVYQTWINRDAERKRKFVHEESIALMKNMIFEALDIYMEFIQALLPLFFLDPETTTYRCISFMNQATIPMIITHWTNMIREFYNYKSNGNFDEAVLDIKKECLLRIQGPPDCPWRPIVRSSLLTLLETNLKLISEMSLSKSSRSSSSSSSS